MRQVRRFRGRRARGRRAPEQIGEPCSQTRSSDPLAELLFWLPASEAYADASGDVVGELPADARARVGDRARARRGRRCCCTTRCCCERRDLLDERARGGGAVGGDRASAGGGAAPAGRGARPRGRGSSRPATRSAAGWSATSTTARSSGSCRSACRLRASSARSRASAQVLAPALDQAVGEIGAAIVDLRQIAAACARRASTTASPPRCATSRATAARPGRGRGAGGTGRREHRSRRLLRRLRGADERGQARVGRRGSTVRAVRQNGTLHVSVADDGVGGADVRRGSGLAGLRDRVAAHGGTLAIASPGGDGTRVEVAIPCDS